MDKLIQELTGLVKDLATGVDGIKTDLGGIKTRQEELEASVTSYKELAQKGFPIPGITAPVPAGTTPADLKEMLAPYSLEMQGKRLIDKIAHPIHRIDDAAREKLAQYFILFLKAGVMNDPAARHKFQDLYGRVDQKLAVEVGDPGNVFPVPDVLMTEILGFARERSVILQYARMWNMTSEKQSFPIETPQSAAVYWGNDTEEGTPVIGEVELEAEELSAYTGVKNTTLMDALTDIVSWLAECMAEAAGLELDNVAFNGDGTKAGCYGILSSLCGNTVTMAGGEFDKLLYTDISAMIAKLPGLRKAGSQFYMSGDILHYVRTMQDDNKRPIFIDPMGFDVPGKIYGYPYQEVIKMPTASALDTAFMAFGNMQYFAIGRRLNTTALSVNPYDQWKQNRTLFKIYQRWALKMAIPDGFVRLRTGAQSTVVTTTTTTTT